MNIIDSKTQNMTGRGILPTASTASGAATALLNGGVGNGGSSQVIPWTHSQGPASMPDIKPFTTLVPQPGGHFGASECVSKLSGSLPAGQQPNKTQVIEGHVRRVPPMIQVLGSKDILPIILGCLRQSFSEWERWRSAFASILRVNRSFAWAGIGILWHTMTSIVPALKLLPWYGNSGYQGLGTYKCTGAQDWERFALYAPSIRKVELNLHPNSSDFIAPHWITELQYLLPSMRPRHAIFPNINSILISSEVSASLPLLPLLVTTSLQSLEIAMSDDADNWQEAVASEIQATLPLIGFYGPSLQSFRYRGPVGKGFLHRLATLRSLTCLFLECADTIPLPASVLSHILELPLLRKLRFASSAPLFTRPTGSLIKPPHPRPAVSDLAVYGLDVMQAIVARELQLACLPLADIYLKVTRIDKPTMLQHAMGSYLGPHLESIRVDISSPWEQQELWPAARPVVVGASEFTIETDTRKSFASACNLKTVCFIGVPSSLWHFMSSVLQDSIGGWKRLTFLTLRIQCHASTSFAQSTSFSANTFPGLSFLATTIWHECACLEHLEFHFDHSKIVNEDLSQAIQSAKNIAPTILYPQGHPLQSLVINTGTNVVDDWSALTFGSDRKVEIITFLELLFPRLRVEALRGAPAPLWGDMGMWLHMYRRLKVEAAK